MLFKVLVRVYRLHLLNVFCIKPFLDCLITGSGTNVSHTIILEPKKSGIFNFTSAQVSYKASEDATDPQVGDCVYATVYVIKLFMKKSIQVSCELSQFFKGLCKM